MNLCPTSTTIKLPIAGNERDTLDWVPNPVKPLKTLFVITSMPVGGAEVLLVNLVRRLRSSHVIPAIACLKEKGPLGDEISHEIPVTDHWLRGKYDLRVLPKLISHIRDERFDAVITVGAGDKMFWGRMAAWLAKVPVICSALHSTGWPDGVGKMNRLLTSMTDAFIAVAKPHGEFLVDFERFPKNKVVVIPNGVDTARFQPDPPQRLAVRKELGIAANAPLIGIVAALRPEKNHALFLQSAKRVVASSPSAHFVMIGEGPERARIENLIQTLSLQGNVSMLGNRADTQRLLAAMNAFALTSHNEASPVSILEALSCGVPVVATRVGSVSESVYDQWNGFTVEPGDADDIAIKLLHLIRYPETAETMGRNGREHVIANGSLDTMVRMYEQLLHRIYDSKMNGKNSA